MTCIRAEKVSEAPAIWRPQVAILFLLAAVFRRHEAAPLGQGPA